jgi:cytochrome b6-f complex iron-sulfur subunit
MIMRGITRYIEDLVRSRRPRRFQATGEDTDLARVAIALRTARPGSGAPAEDFVTALHKKLAAELDPPAPPRAIAGRRALLRVAAVAGAMATGAGIDNVLTRTTAPASSAAGTLTPSHGTWLTVAASADLPDGTVRSFTADALTGFIERADGQLRAVSGICTHQGCRLALAADAAKLVCPCHGATFGLDGAVLNHVFPVPLAALPQLEVREIDGTVQVCAPASTGPASPRTS